MKTKNFNDIDAQRGWRKFINSWWTGPIYKENKLSNQIKKIVVNDLTGNWGSKQRPDNGGFTAHRRNE